MKLILVIAGWLLLPQAAGLIARSHEIWIELPVVTGGLRCTDSNTGTGFIMYTREEVNTRWSLDIEQYDFRKHTAKNFVCVRYQNNTWQYDTNWADEADRASNVSWHPFHPRSTDILVASVDFTQDKAISLNRTCGLTVNGMQVGYVGGDIHFFGDQSINGSFDDGEFRVNGSRIFACPFLPEKVQSQLTSPLKPVVNGSVTRLPVQSGGIRCTDSNAGTGFIMFSLVDINSRWNLDKTENDFRMNAAKNFVCVRYADNTWQYDTNWEDEPDRDSRQSWHVFIPVKTDILMATVDFTRDTVMDMKESNLTYKGVQMGYQEGDLIFEPNQNMNGSVDAGEFRLAGTYFYGYHPPISATTTTTTTTGTTTPTTTTTTTQQYLLVKIRTGGFRCTDKNIGSGYIMYTKQGVNERFNLLQGKKDFTVHTATNFLCIRCRNGTWQYDTNWQDEGRKVASWRNFTPVATDVAVALVDYTKDKVTSLKGANLKYKGLQMGYKDGDLSVFPGNSDLSFNLFGSDDHFGEFRTGGSYMMVYNPRSR
eukprot:TRINITY_DN41061_c0_g1_i1.p1 TRINITY_DN41061_c0_g1~~TRINITY_DN41061_c0_g1_i1.p1  ORF type:complete len:537 (-),score=77.46 TRINITY_DN41061_c0_g1_i1:141-1751(-)